MRIRLTLDIERRPKPADDDTPDIYNLSAGSHDLAPRRPIGFTAEPGRVEPDWEDQT